MGSLRLLGGTVVQTLLRVLPFACTCGLVRIGRPGRDSPVLLTGNFQLTVERVKRALRGADAYLLVADSRGVNVWCAATGGLFTDHDVVTALKTSGIEGLVDHRRLILPQLAATGIDANDLHRRTGWRVVWGPVEAEQIPRFLASGGEKTPDMRTVSFPWRRRLEMAVAWAFPISLLALLVWPLWPGGALPLAGLVWGLSLAMFLCFPLYRRRLNRRAKSLGFVFFDFGERAVPLVVWALLMGGVTAYAFWATETPWAFVGRWGIASLATLLILSLDLTGSTPVYKSGLHPERLFRIALDDARCRGAGLCEDVCPVDVFVVDRPRRIATIPSADRCVQCGACIVQCPFDALSFRGPAGEIVTPDTVRRFKLNLLGTRARRPEAPDVAEPP